jgi:uncharacterized metal-binding protein YceD (DUF177 family)
MSSDSAKFTPPVSPDRQTSARPTVARPWRISDLAPGRAHAFDIEFTTAEMGAVAEILGVANVRKMRMKGTLSPQGPKNWDLLARVGASITQTCVVTLGPVQTRLDEDVRLHFAPGDSELSGDSVTEMDPDVLFEPLSDEIDLAQIAIEALALALPMYPRIPGAALETTVFAPPGVAALTDEDAKPFASLAALKDKMQK